MALDHEQPTERTSNRDLLIRLDERSRGMNEQMDSVLETLKVLTEKVTVGERTTDRLETRITTLETRPEPAAQFTPEQVHGVIRILEWFEGRTGFHRALPTIIANSIVGVVFSVMLFLIETRVI